MANVLSLAMKIGADASGFKLDPVTRALRSLGDEVTKTSSVFDKFKATSAAAAEAQAEVDRQLKALIEARKADQIGSQEFEKQFKAITEAAKEQAAAFEEGAALTERFRSEEEKRAAQLERVSGLLEKKAIDEQTAARAVAELSGANAVAAEAAKQAASDEQAAARIRDANLTALERAQRTYDAAIAEATRLESIGKLTKADLNAETQRQAAILAKVRTEAEGAAKAASTQALKFNELSGVFAALPGPLGNIAGRISGLSSAGEGLARVFSGGLKQGFSSVGASLAGLINPLTAALAGVTAFAAAATKIGQGLTQLEDRVEKLGNTADKLGISFEFVQVLDEAARRSGTSIDAVSAAFGRLQKSVLGVDEESKAAQAALAQIGVTAEQLQTLKPEEQYLLIGQRLAAIEDPARRTAASINLFGKAGADLLPFFRNIGGAASDLERVGAALSTRQRQDIDEFGGAMDRLSVATKGAGEQILASFAPAGEAIANALATASGAVAQYVQEQNRLAGESQKRRELEGLIFGRRATDDELALLKLGKTADEVYRRIVAQDQIKLKTGVWVQLTDALVDVEIAGKGAAGAVENVAAAADQVQQLSAKSQESLDKAIQRVGEYGQAGFDATLKYQEGLRDIDAMVAENELTEEQAAQARRNATTEYERQIAIIKQGVDEKKKAADEAKKLADREIEAIQSIIDKTEEQIRIERDFGGDAARARNADDLNRIREEIAKTEAELAEANAAGDTEAAARAAARLAQFDQVEAKLAEAESNFAERADQTAQGFADGFDKAFEATTRGLDGIIDKAAQFGNEGAKAAQELQDGIARAQEQVKAGILSRPAYDAEVAAQRKIFEDRVAQVAALEQLDRQRREREFQGQVDANARINAFMQAQVGEQQRAEAEAVAENFKRRQEAAENLLAIEQRIATQRQAIEAAREQNDMKAAKARVAELKALEALQKQERAIAQGRQQSVRQASTFAQTQATAQAAQQQSFTNAVQQQVGSLQSAANNAIALTNEAFAKAADRQRKIINDLSTLGSRTVQTADVRTQEGAALVLGLAANAQDPRLIEQRLANKLLRQIAGGLVSNLNRIGIPAFIPG